MYEAKPGMSCSVSLSCSVKTVLKNEKQIYAQINYVYFASTDSFIFLQISSYSGICHPVRTQADSSITFQIAT